MSRSSRLLIPALLWVSAGCCCVDDPQPDGLTNKVGLVDAAVTRVHSDVFDLRQRGTQELAAKDPETMHGRRGDQRGAIVVAAELYGKSIQEYELAQEVGHSRVDDSTLARQRSALTRHVTRR